MKLCVVEECEKPAPNRRMCHMHAKRLRLYGDVTVVNPRVDPERTGYSAAHRRVERSKGRASSHLCIECDQPAKHWSYDGLDPREKRSPRGPFSIHVDHYRPMCVPCHKKSDLRRRRSAA